VAVEVHLAVAAGADDQRLAVLPDRLQGDLAVHLDDRFDGPVPRERVDIVLLVAPLVEMEVDTLSVRPPLDVPARVARYFSLAPLLAFPGLRVDDVEFVAPTDIVIDGDFVAIGRGCRVCERRQTRQLFEYVGAFLFGHPPKLTTRTV